MDIDTCWIKLEEREAKVREREDALEEKWNKFSKKIDEQPKQMSSNSEVSIDNTKIDNEIWQGLTEMCQCKQEFNKLHTNCSFNLSNLADKKQEAIEKVVQEQKADLEKCIQTQREILDQATKDSQIKLNIISNEVTAERQMIDTQLQSYDQKTK